MDVPSRQEAAAQWVSENVTTGMLPSEMIANEGGDPSSFFINEQDFSADILSVSSGSDSEIGNTRRIEELLRRPEQSSVPPGAQIGGYYRSDTVPKTSSQPQRRPMLHHRYQNPHCSQTVFCRSPRRYLINSNGVGPRRYVINNNDLGMSHYKLRLPGFSQDLDVKIGASSQFVNDSSQVLEKIDSMLRKQHESLERHVMEVFDRHLSMI